jgi:hypothetical protein
MKKNIPFLFILTILLLSACAPKQLMTSETELETIQELNIFQPVSVISLIHQGDGNEAKYNDSLSTIARENISLGIYEYLSNRYSLENLTLDYLTQETVNNEIYQMTRFIQYQKTIENIPFPPTIDSIMKSNNSDYALCILQLGFSREKGNYGAQVAKGALTALLTLGMYYTTPVKASSDLTICIIDRKSQSIIFHNKSILQENEPIEKKVTDKQIKSLFDEYFYND